MTFGPAFGDAGQRFDNAGTDQCTREDEHGRDGDGGGIGENLFHLAARKIAQHQHDGRAAHGDGHRRKPFRGEQNEQPDQQAEADPGRIIGKERS